MEVDVAAIGAGQAAVSLVHELAAQGKATVLIERDKLGGCCVNYGCTPTKAALASARRAADARNSADLGISADNVQVDFAKVIGRARGIAEAGSAHLESQFVDGPAKLVHGHARLWGRDGERFRILVDDGPEILAKSVVLDVGSSTTPPPIPGIDGIAFICSENWLQLDQLPEHLLMLGGGTIGLEMAQFYCRMGARVTIIDGADRLCAREDERVSEQITAALTTEGVDVRTGVKIEAIEATSAGVRMRLADDTLEGSHLFVATGRKPSIGELGLDGIGLAPAEGGIIDVDNQLRTEIPGVYAAGDVRGGMQLTSTAWDDHRILLSVLGRGDPHTLRRVSPYAIFTDPEIARVGLSEWDARQKGLDVHCTCFPYGSIAKAREDGRETGFVALVADIGRDRLLGATVVGENAAELIHLFALVLELDAPLAVIERGVYVHPTLSEGLQSAVTALRSGR